MVIIWARLVGVPYIKRILIKNTINMKKSKIYSEFAKIHHVPDIVSLEEVEERIEQSAREEEADNIVLAEDKRMPD